MSEIEQIVQERAQIIKSQGELTLITAQCMTLLTASKARQRELEEQGLIKRFFRNFSGKNGRLSRAISGDLITAQLAAQEMIHHLAKRQVLTLDIICAMQQKMHNLQYENDLNFMKLVNLIEKVHSDSVHKIQQLQEQISKVETNVNVMHWYLTKDQKNYHLLNLPTLALTIVKDFYTLTNGQWTDQDLLYIEKLLTDLQMNKELAYEDVAQQQELLHLIFKLVPALPEGEQIYLTDIMQILYKGYHPRLNQTFPARNMILEMLNTLILIEILTRPIKKQYQVVLHQLENPDKRIHIIRTLHLEAGLPQDTSRDLTWSAKPAIVKVYESEDKAQKLKKALEHYKCLVTIEEIEITV